MFPGIIADPECANAKPLFSTVQTLPVRVDQVAVVMFLGKRLRDMSARLSCIDNDDIHS